MKRLFSIFVSFWNLHFKSSFKNALNLRQNLIRFISNPHVNTNSQKIRNQQSNSCQNNPKQINRPQTYYPHGINTTDNRDGKGWKVLICKTNFDNYSQPPSTVPRRPLVSSGLRINKDLVFALYLFYLAQVSRISLINHLILEHI